MALIRLAQEADPTFAHFLFGWMGRLYHAEMAMAARIHLNEYSSPASKNLLKNFDEALDKTLDTQV